LTIDIPLSLVCTHMFWVDSNEFTLVLCSFHCQRSKLSSQFSRCRLSALIFSASSCLVPQVWRGSVFGVTRGMGKAVG
jgi:hypothetical protein